jgi:hypothetical protein
MSDSRVDDRPVRWAVAVEDLGSLVSRRRATAVVELLRELSGPANLVEDGDPAGLEVDALLLMDNVIGFGRYRAALARRKSRRPVTAVWMLETLPPESLSSEAEAVGLSASAWSQRLGLLTPKQAAKPWRRALTARNLPRV